MADDVVRFLDSISYQGDREILKNIEIVKVFLHKNTETFEVLMKNHQVLPYEVVKELFEACKNKIHQKENCYITLQYEEVTEEDLNGYVEALLKEVVEKKPSLVGVLDTIPVCQNKTCKIGVSNRTVEEEMKKETKKMEETLKGYGLGKVNFEIAFDEEMQKSIKEEIQKDKEEREVVEVKPKIEGNILLGKAIDGEPTAINNIMGDAKNVIIEAYIFGIDTLERENINIITLKVSDKTNSILAKIFKRDKKEYQAVMGSLKAGNWYRIQGNVEFDNFAKDLVLSIRNMEKIDSKDEVVKDEAEIPRVELHAHTMMSAMDGVIDAKTLVKHAAKMGHKAIAVTDHNCVQAFQDLYHAVCDLNKGKEGSDRFKVLYGAEMNVVNNDVDIIFNPSEYNLLTDTFVVFDTETTGFYAGSDQMIEIGAVKIKDGKIIDRFD